MAVITTPIAAEQAREMLTDARVATLHTASAAAGSSTSSVMLGAVGDGVPRLVLAPTSAAVPALAACRVATLTICEPGSSRRVRIVASYRMARPDVSGHRAYEATILSVRLDGAADFSGAVTVPVEEFLRVEPDLERVRRSALMAHLEAEHSDHLVARVRRLGHDCEVVLVHPAPELGIDLHLLGPHGAGRLRLTQSDLADRGLASVCACPASG